MGPLSFLSSEQAYQFHACEEHLRADLAEEVLQATTPREAKRIANTIKEEDPLSMWNHKKYDVMREVHQAKLESNCSFREQLLNSGEQILVEASQNDMYWGSGLSYFLTTTTEPDKAKTCWKNFYVNSVLN